MTRWSVLIPIGLAALLWVVGIVRLDTPRNLGNPIAAHQPCLPTAADVAMTEVASGGESGPTPTPVKSPLVTTELVVLAGDEEVPKAIPSLIIRFPGSSVPELQSLLKTSLVEVDSAEGSAEQLDARNRFRDQLEALLVNAEEHDEDFGIFTGGTSGDTNELVQKVLDIRNPPIIGILPNGTQTIIVPYDEQVLADSSESEGSGATLRSVGGWVISSSGRKITFRFNQDVDTRTGWDVSVCTDGLPIILAGLTTPTPASSLFSDLDVSPTPTATPTATATPNPDPHPEQHGLLVLPSASKTPTPNPMPQLDFQNANAVHWVFPPSTQASQIKGVEVIVQTSPLGAVRMWLFTDDWRKGVVASLTYLLPVGLLLAGFWLVRRPAAAHSQSDAAKARLATIIWSIVRLSIAAVLSLLVAASATHAWSVLIPRLLQPTADRTDPNDGWKSSLLQVKDSVIPEAWQVEGFPLLLLVLVALVVVGLGLLGTSGRVEASTQHRGIDLLLQVTVAVALIACFVYLSQLNVRDAYKFPLITPAFLLAGYTMFLASAVHAWRQRRCAAFQPAPRWFLPAVGAISVLVCVLRFPIEQSALVNRSVSGGILLVWITFCVVVGVALLTALLVHAETDKRSLLAPSADPRPQRVDTGNVPSSAGHHSNVVTAVRPRGTGRVAQCIYIGLLTLAILVQWEWANFSQQNIWWRAPVEADPTRYLPEDANTQLFLSQPTYGPALLGAMIDILVLLGLAGFWGVLRGTGAESPTPFWRDHERWVEIVLAGLFAALVIGYGGQLLGFRAPVAFALGGFFLLLTLTKETESTSSAIDRENGGSKDGRPLVAAHRSQLLRRALARVGLKQPPPVNDFTPPLKLPSERAAGSMALSIGPEGNWWQNGLEAWRLGVWLAGLPVAYFIYVFLSTGAGGWSWSAPFATAGLVSAFVFEVAFWLVAAFTFGCLFPYLRGQNGLVKGVALAAVYIAAHAAAALLGIPGNALWQVRSFQLLLFLILLGAWLDFRSLETCGYSWRELIALYELPRTTTLIRQGLPLVIALAGVLVQLYSHQTQAATESLLTGDASQAILCFLQSVSNAPCR